MPDMLDSALDSPETDLPSSVSVSRQYSRDAATSPASASTVSIQGSGNHYHACTSDDYDDVGFDPSILPPPDPWIDSLTEDPLEGVQRSVCQRDGRWFLKLLQAETDRMEGWCRQMEQEEMENELSDESEWWLHTCTYRCTYKTTSTREYSAEYVETGAEVGLGYIHCFPSLYIPTFIPSFPLSVCVLQMTQQT